MTGAVKQANARHFCLGPIQFDVSRSFRKEYLEDVRLIEDTWDLYSEHFGLFTDSELIGTYRLVSPSDGRLPISEHAPGLEVDRMDRQVGRFVTARRLWTLAAGAALFGAYVEQLRQALGRTYVATAERGPVSARRYQTLGFLDTGIAYRDARYPRSMLILMKPRA